MILRSNNEIKTNLILKKAKENNSRGEVQHNVNIL